ncbi:MAG: lytic murein transglycosylase B [Gammaproteobacteria bacterium]|nr:lytic murein transglycosylase B [Gammaproteobacteria bacterium]
MFKIKTLSLIALFVLLNSAATLASERSLNKNPIIIEFIDQMVKKDKFDRKELVALFDEVKTHPEIIEKLDRPAEAWPWHRYRNIFLKQERIDQGVQFWNENEALLAKAEKELGVDAKVIVGILGVETRYGRKAGNYRVVDALTTIVVDYPRRSKYFKKELRHVLLLAREEKISPLEFKGSYAGAMGKAQFMPSSYRNFAIDFDNDGRRDLIENTSDAVGSIASYLKKHGWKLNQPVTARATVSGEKYKKYVAKGMKPKVKVADINKYAVKTNAIISADEKASLIELEQKENNEYWLGLSNFYAITRYNHSNLYAMAVFQLSEEIKAKREKLK